MPKRLATLLIFLTTAIIPIHAQDSNGPSPIGFLDTSQHSYDYLVDSSLSQDDPANRQFRTLQAAYAAAPEGTAAKPTVIGIKPGVYHITSDTTAPGLTISKNYLTLVGLTKDHRNVVLADNRGNQQGASNNGHVIVVNANGFSAINLTFLNYCNVDYEYPGDQHKNLKARSDVITQAVALQASGDKHVYDHVAFLSKLDTTFIQTTRAWLKNVFIEGTDDFIGGGTISVWDHSVIHFPTGSGVTTVSGTVFIDTTFTVPPGGTMQIYKSPGRPAALINCVLPVNKGQSVAWVRGVAPPRPNLYSLTYHNKDADGKPAVITDGSRGPIAFTLSRELSDQEALAFNPWNLLRATPTGPADDWDPAGARERYEGLGQGSLVYRMAMTGGSPNIITGKAEATIGATVSPARAAQTITWSAGSNLVSLSNTEGPSTVVTGRNSTGRAQYVPVKATAANGFYATAWVYVQPAYIDPPTLTSGPELSAPSNGTLALSYGLNNAAHTDQSIVTWFSCEEPSCANARTVAVSRSDVPLAVYTLTPGDVGKYLRVTIQPKLEISDPGAAGAVTATAPIAKSAIASTTVSPNFTNFVTTANNSYVSGYWTVLGSWTSVSGSAFVNGFGVRAASAGSALLYQQDEPAGDMQIDVAMSPEKTEGQGFGLPGSAADGNTQNADIFIKYDPRTQTGYSLRWWRTTQSARKCMFQLYQHTRGVGTPVSPTQELTGVFKPNTYMTLSIVGSTFTVKAHNDVDSETLSLSANVPPNVYGGAGVRWSGSAPIGNSNVFSSFRISYPVAGQGAAGR